MSNSEQLLSSFWDAVLDLAPEELHSRSMLASHFSKINGTFMTKKPAEVLMSLLTNITLLRAIIDAFFHTNTASSNRTYYPPYRISGHRGFSVPDHPVG